MKLTGGTSKRKTEKPEKSKKAAQKKPVKTKPDAKRSSASGAGGERIKKLKIVAVASAIVVALLFAAAAVGVYYVSTIDEIYPNVSLDGHELGGMTATQAAALLDEKGYSSQEGKKLTVHLPLEVSLSISASEVCSETPIADLVQRVYEETSGGSAISNAINYIKCSFGGMKLESEILITVDKDAVAAKVDGVIRELNLKLMESGVEIGEKSISVTKGASGITLDAEEITQLIITAFENGDYSDISYEAKIETDEELDVELSLIHI